jgi:glycosyltransferase involved in cell wall biosynthesis
VPAAFLKRAAMMPREDAASEKPLRVIHVVTGLALGGAETVLSRLVTNMPDITHAVVSLGGPEWYSRVLEDAGVEVHHLNMRSLSPGGLVRLRRIVRGFRPDVIQCWMYRANLVGGLVGRLAGVPTVWNIRCSSPEGLRLGSRLAAYAGGVLAPMAADFIINCSTRSTELHRKLGYARSPGTVIPNGYDLEGFTPDDSAAPRLRDGLGMDPGTFLVGSISRWDRQKDLPNLLAAVRIAADAGVPIRCLLAGAGLDEQNEALRREIGRSGCTQLVTPLGRRSDVIDLARAIDLHVLASSVEGFPNAVAETMACGTVNVVTDVGDSATIVGETGWVVPPRDPKALGEAIAEAYRERQNSASQWKARQSAARARIVENFSLEKMVSAYRALWENLAARNADALAKG